MRIFRNLSAVALLTAACSVAALAQRPAATPPARPGATPAGQTASAPTPTAKMGFIDTQAFLDEKNGITRLVAVLQQVNREFKPRQDKIQLMQADIQKRTTDLETLSKSSVVDPTKLNAQAEELERKKKELTREQEDAQAAYQQRQMAVAEPLQDEIGRAIDDFAAKRGITVMLNASVLGQSILYVAPGVDLTADFIKDFNARPPAPVTPGRQP